MRDKERRKPKCYYRQKKCGGVQVKLGDYTDTYNASGWGVHVIGTYTKESILAHKFIKICQYAGGVHRMTQSVLIDTRDIDWFNEGSYTAQIIRSKSMYSNTWFFLYIGGDVLVLQHGYEGSSSNIQVRTTVSFID